MINLLKSIFFIISFFLFYGCEFLENTVDKRDSSQGDTLMTNEYIIKDYFVNLNIQQFGSDFKKNSVQLFFDLKAFKLKLKEIEKNTGVLSNDEQILFGVWVYYHSGNEAILYEFPFQGKMGNSSTKFDKLCVGDAEDAAQIFFKGLLEMENEAKDSLYMIKESDNHWISGSKTCYSSRISNSKLFFGTKVPLQTNIKIKTVIFKGNDVKLFENSNNYIISQR